MNRAILYYPTINIPSASWLRHAVLYYDEVSSIVPQAWENRDLFGYSPDIQYLMDENQFRPRRPEDLVFDDARGEAFDAFREEFSQLISDPLYDRRKRISRLNYRLHRDKMVLPATSKIHRNKVADSIYNLLEEKGLVSGDDSEDWLQMEEHTALVYMSLLAKYLADIDGDQTTIGTDHGFYERQNFRRVSANKGFPVVSVNLSSILPSPRANVPLERIIDFKRKRADNLMHFKKMLSDFHVNIAKCQSQAELKVKIMDFREMLTNGVNDLNALFADSRMMTVFKGFKSLISLKSPTTWLTAAAALNAKYQVSNVPFNWEAFGIGAVGMLEIASCYIEAGNQRDLKLRESPFSYVYAASRHRIINKP